MGVLLAIFVYLCLLSVVVENLILGESIPLPRPGSHALTMSSPLSLLNDRNGGRLLRLWLLTLAIRVLVLKASQHE